MVLDVLIAIVCSLLIIGILIAYEIMEDMKKEYNKTKTTLFIISGFLTAIDIYFFVRIMLLY